MKNRVLEIDIPETGICNLAWELWEHKCKVEAVLFPHHQPPESVTDVEFGEYDPLACPGALVIFMKWSSLCRTFPISLTGTVGAF